MANIFIYLRENLFPCLFSIFALLFFTSKSFFSLNFSLTFFYPHFFSLALFLSYNSLSFSFLIFWPTYLPLSFSFKILLFSSSFFLISHFFFVLVLVLLNIFFLTLLLFHFNTFHFLPHPPCNFHLLINVYLWDKNSKNRLNPSVNRWENFYFWDSV